MYRRPSTPLLLPVICLLTSVFFNCSSPTPPPPGFDTTSHEFIWRIDTLGVGNASALYDVAIINDTTVWAVGEIFLKDSTEQLDPTAYGLAKWNGRRWTYERLSAMAPSGYRSNLVPRGLFARSAGEIWFAAGGVHRLTDGILVSFWINAFPGNPVPIWADGQFAERLWGNAATNMYTVGTQGAIAHFNGSTWTKLASGTTVDLIGLWGSPEGSSVWACGYRDFVGTVLLRLSASAAEIVYSDNDHWYVIRQDSLSGVLTGVWTGGENTLFVASPAGLYRCPFSTRGEGTRLSFSDGHFPGFPNALHGQSSNDLVIAGDFSLLAHYNGRTWYSYSGFGPRIRWKAVRLQGNLLVAAGKDLDTQRAVVLRGYR